MNDTWPSSLSTPRSSLTTRTWLQGRIGFSQDYRLGGPMLLRLWTFTWRSRYALWDEKTRDE